MRHILVPTDFSETAQAALVYAVDLCHDLRGRITLLHVLYTDRLAQELQGLDAFEYLSDAAGRSPDSAQSKHTENVGRLKQRAEEKLQQLVDPSWRDLVRIDAACDEGRPSVKITDYARQHNVDLIVMGTHGRGPVARFFLGSVAENVIRAADCPVLTVRQPSRPNP